MTERRRAASEPPRQPRQEHAWWPEVLELAGLDSRRSSYRARRRRWQASRLRSGRTGPMTRLERRDRQRGREDPLRRCGFYSATTRSFFPVQSSNPLKAGRGALANSVVRERRRRGEGGVVSATSPACPSGVRRYRRAEAAFFSGCCGPRHNPVRYAVSPSNSRRRPNASGASNVHGADRSVGPGSSSMTASGVCSCRSRQY
jgi:hypothetical protein